MFSFFNLFPTLFLPLQRYPYIKIRHWLSTLGGCILVNEFIIPFFFFFAQDWWLIKLWLITEFITLKIIKETPHLQLVWDFYYCWVPEICTLSFLTLPFAHTSLAVLGFPPLCPAWADVLVTLQLPHFHGGQGLRCPGLGSRPWNPLGAGSWWVPEPSIPLAGGSTRSSIWSVGRRRVCERREHQTPAMWAKVSCVYPMYSSLLPKTTCQWVAGTPSALWQHPAEMSDGAGTACRLIHCIELILSVAKSPQPLSNTPVQAAWRAGWWWALLWQHRPCFWGGAVRQTWQSSWRQYAGGDAKALLPREPTVALVNHVISCVFSSKIGLDAKINTKQAEMKASATCILALKCERTESRLLYCGFTFCLHGSCNCLLGDICT